MNDSIGDFFRWIANHKYLFVTIAFVLIMLFFDENNFIKHLRNRSEIAVLKSDIEDMQSEYQRVLLRLEELDKDVDVMEKVAREKYGMHLDGEDVFIINN